MATYNRSNLLANQLIAFENQTIDKSRFEVVIVNDGSPDRTKQLLDNWSRKYLNLKVVHQENGGPASARNKGVCFATGRIIAFTDDDCIVDNDWLENIVRAFGKDKDLKVLHGLTYSNKKEINPFTHQIENDSWSDVVPTCNAAYLKDVFVELEGFDTNYPFPHNEDTDLAWKAHEVTDVKFVDSVRVYHPAVKVPFKSQLKRMRFLRSEFLLFKKHPKAYQKWRTKNPWLTIYKEVFFKHQFLTLKSNIKYIVNPILFVRSMVLTISCWFYLILLLPEYWIEFKKWQTV
jgi:glycosyltransferase involved in cell wall biosynthesis